MPLAVKPRIALVAIVLFSILLIYQRQRIVTAIRPPEAPSTVAHEPPPKLGHFPTTPIADEASIDNLLRNQEQCLADFPDLYEAIDGSVEHYKTHPISRPDLEKAFEGNEAIYTWVIIRNNQLFIRSRHPGFQSRVQALLASLHRAILTSPERLPDVEFLFDTADGAPDVPYTPVFGLSRRLKSGAFLIPDFSYWAWPERLVSGFAAFERAVEGQASWEEKKEQLFWRGDAGVHPQRERLVEMTEKYSESWGNVKGVNWGLLGEDDFYDMAEHCRFRYLAHVEGATFSARLKYLQFCESVIVMLEPQWTTHLSHLLRSEEGEAQNVVVAGKTFDGLDELMIDLLADPEKSRKIAGNSREVFGRRYGRLGAEVCYWRQLVRGWHSVMDEDLKRSVSAGEGGEEKDYESVMLMGRTQWGVEI